MFKLVPFNAMWINHDKIDIHAIYRRPRYVQDQYGEFARELDAGGVPTWDLTGPLPVKQHTKWVAKGFEYVTLADRASLLKAAQFGTVLGDNGEPTDYRVYDQHQTGGPWNYRKYAEGQAQTTTRDAEQLRADCERYGADVVEAIRRQTDATFRLPDHLRSLGPNKPGKAAKGSTEAA